MGYSTLILVAGLTIIITTMSISSNEQILSLTQKTTERSHAIMASMNVTSAAHIAVSNFLADPSWRGGVANSSLNGGNLSATIIDTTAGRIYISSTGSYAGAARDIQILARYRPPLDSIAVSTTGTVVNVTTLDENSNPDPSLLSSQQDWSYDIDDQALYNLAASQSHIETGSNFSPGNNYPNGSFYYSGQTPNVTHVLGDLLIGGNQTIYGIFYVEGDVTIQGNATLEGVLYLPNETSILLQGGGNLYPGSVIGGIISTGDIDGAGNHIYVEYEPTYLTHFSQYGDTGASVLVYSWKEYKY
ncbi:MAG: hypothetical protein O6932_06790 [Gammaproteobacteria bacterium]|nr:hypothetical protein [Gammaproteobacteria bacterium]